MSSPPTIEMFKGTSWEECDEFICAIRAAAWKQGKLRDSGWMADFASLHFSRKARSWQSRLPQDVRQDWEKLEVALLDRWAPPAEDDEPPIEPSPAAAPSLNRSDKAGGPLQGILKVVFDGSDEDCYLQIDHGQGRGKVTENADQALRVRCNSSPKTTLLETIEKSRHFWLGVQWGSATPNLNNGSTSHGYLVLVDSFSLKTSSFQSYPYQIASCTVSADGEVIPFWRNDDASEITLGIFSNNAFLFLAADSGAYSKKYPREKRAKILIEAID